MFGVGCFGIQQTRGGGFFAPRVRNIRHAVLRGEYASNMYIYSTQENTTCFSFFFLAGAAQLLCTWKSPPCCTKSRLRPVGSQPSPHTIHLSTTPLSMPAAGPLSAVLFLFLQTHSVRYAAVSRGPSSPVATHRISTRSTEPCERPTQRMILRPRTRRARSGPRVRPRARRGRPDD